MHAHTHTEVVCARPGFCREEQVVSQQSPYGLELKSGTQRWRDEGRDRTERKVGGKHVRKKG